MYTFVVIAILLCSSTDAHWTSDFQWQERLATGYTLPLPPEKTFVTQTVFVPAGHGGVDIAVCDKVTRLDVLSVGDGEVTQVCDNTPDGDESTICSVNGNFVRVKYDVGNGPFIMQYGHLTTGSLAVKVGDKVIGGQKLGQMGQSGKAFGLHTHFHLFGLDFSNLNEDFRDVFGLDNYGTSCSRRIRQNRRRGVAWPHD